MSGSPRKLPVGGQSNLVHPGGKVSLVSLNLGMLSRKVGLIFLRLESVGDEPVYHVTMGIVSAIREHRGLKFVASYLCPVSMSPCHPTQDHEGNSDGPI